MKKETKQQLKVLATTLIAITLSGLCVGILYNTMGPDVLKYTQIILL